ncbi:MAG: hypothetical protein OSJ62_00730 [Lachnospiraceae bacterium]|nr:hypothetical protein [Lachnospiraceae bacterium]
MSFWLSVPADRIVMDLFIQMKDEFLAGSVPADTIMFDSFICRGMEKRRKLWKNIARVYQRHAVTSEES